MKSLVDFVKKVFIKPIAVDTRISGLDLIIPSMEYADAFILGSRGFTLRSFSNFLEQKKIPVVIHNLEDAHIRVRCLAVHIEPIEQFIRECTPVALCVEVCPVTEDEVNTDVYTYLVGKRMAGKGCLMLDGWEWLRGYV